MKFETKNQLEDFENLSIEDGDYAPSNANCFDSNSLTALFMERYVLVEFAMVLTDKGVFDITIDWKYAAINRSIRECGRLRSCSHPVCTHFASLTRYRRETEEAWCWLHCSNIECCEVRMSRMCEKKYMVHLITFCCNAIKIFQSELASVMYRKKDRTGYIQFKHRFTTINKLLLNVAIICRKQDPLVTIM